MNDGRLNAILQLNGGSQQSPPDASAQLEDRELYIHNTGNYAYLYVGKGTSRGAYQNPLKVAAQYADESNLSHRLTSFIDDSNDGDVAITIGASADDKSKSGALIFLYPKGEGSVTAGQRRAPSISIHNNAIYGTEDKNDNYPTIYGFNMVMYGGTQIRPASKVTGTEDYVNSSISINGLSLTQIPRLTLYKDTDAVYGTSLPLSGVEGQVFFLISE